MKKGIDRENLNPEVNPKEDFYHYAAGGWIARNPIPDDESRYGVFSVLSKKSREDVKELILTLGDNPESKIKDTPAQKVCDMYHQGLDMERRNREGIAPMKPYLEQIEKFTLEKLPEYAVWMSKWMGFPLFGFGINIDKENPNRYILGVGGYALTLGDRDYYLEKTEKNLEILEAFEKNVKALLILAGYSQEVADRSWKTLIDFEMEIAAKEHPREYWRDPRNTYNIVSRKELAEKYPELRYEECFRLNGFECDVVNVLTVDNLQQVNNFLKTQPEDKIKDLMRIAAVDYFSNKLSDDFYQANFEFSKVISGVKERTPQWRRALAMTQGSFADLIGRLYAEKHFRKEKKEYMVGLVENLRKALAEHIRGLDWMQDTTKQCALEKLSALGVKIGYPDKWKDYEGIHIDPSRSYADNIIDANIWLTEDTYAKLRKPVDKSEWYMSPYTVNAYYSPIKNEICFPAAILQPPFFDYEADDAQNYGAIGVIIGHEMTHGFDDSGRKFDLNGALNEWWTAEDEEEFNKRTEILVKQFDEVEVAPGVHANGKYTLGENIADQGGLRVALTAYRNAVPVSARQEIDGFSPLQRFYLSYAQCWGSTIRDEIRIDSPKEDVHSLPEHRVNVTLRNIKEFLEAFDIQPGDSLFRLDKDRVIIW